MKKDVPTSIRIEIVKDDADVLRDIIKDRFIYSCHTRDRPDRRTQSSIIISDSKFSQYLLDNDFRLKSSRFTEKILNKIDEKIIHCFWRGFLDGDGHIARTYAEFSAPINFNWMVLKNLCRKLKVGFSIIKYTSPTTGDQHSKFKINHKNYDSIKFLDYIYKDYNGIGLPRKYNKYLKLTEYIRCRYTF